MYKGLHHAIARCDAMASEDSSHSKRISKVLNHSHAFEPINFPPEMSEGPLFLRKIPVVRQPIQHFLADGIPFSAL